MPGFNTRKNYSAAESSLQLLSDIDETGRKAYYFIRVAHTQFSKFLRHAKSNAPMNLAEYGEIVYSAYGEQPPRHIQDWARSEHGWLG